MLHAKDNPKSNEIPLDIKEEKLVEMISKSGYPLQTVISNQLKELSFRIQQEWTYIDSESKEERNLDILASKKLIKIDRIEDQPLITPYLDLLIECKRSDSPYVFFLTSGRSVGNFPNFTGLMKERLEVHSEAGVFFFSYSSALSLHELPFIKDKNEVCLTFSRVVGRGEKLDLKADIPYNEIVKPLIKAIKYYQLQKKAKSTYRHFPFRLIVGLVIIDAPMIVVKVGEKGNELELSPWVRVNRMTVSEPEDEKIRHKDFSFDVVHKDYLEKYMREYLLPLAYEFVRRVEKHEKELVSGKSYIKFKTGDFLGPDIESQLRPDKD
jgi:hypothetical protein